jgi:hypothetical protein
MHLEIFQILKGGENIPAALSVDVVPRAEW